MVVMQRSGESGLLPVSESKVALRLQREVSPDGEISEQGIRRIISILRDFDAVSKSANVTQMITVATSAVRNTTDQDGLLKYIESETGIRIKVLTGEEEAEATFNGAIASLPILDGAVIDIGGGSMEIVHFESRQLVRTVTLPLGALRLSDQFLSVGHVSERDQRKLVKHVNAVLNDKGVEKIASHGEIIGTGGTVRNAGKLDRRRGGHRFSRLHGHRVKLKSLSESLAELSAMEANSLRGVPGLNPERSDSILGGMAALGAAVQFLNRDSFIVSGAGLREGIALKAFGVTNGRLNQTAEQSVADMCGRFSTWEPDRASRRSDVATVVCEAFHEAISEEVAEAVRLAAAIVDAGSAIDYYQRYRSAGLLAVNSNAGLLTHRQIALVSALCAAADRDSIEVARYAGEISKNEVDELRRAGVLLRIADQIEMRQKRGTETTLKIVRSGKRSRDTEVLFAGGSNWPKGSLHRHYSSVFRGLLKSSESTQV